MRLRSEDSSVAGPESTVVDRKYRLVRRIAVGGQGAVHEAEALATGRRVAVKVLRTDRAADPTHVERFRREAVIARSISHENICEVLDSGETEDGLYLVMPLLEGAALSSVVKKGPLSEGRALRIVDQILCALGAAHAMGVVHRDLKPSNIFVSDADDRRDFVKVLDFGVSKIVGPSPVAPATITQTGAVLGTPQYMALEQIRGGRTVDARCDVYACGVILYEMVVGRHAFSGDNMVQLIFSVVSGTFDPPRAVRPEVSVATEKIILRAMKLMPEERFADAAEMLAAVRDIEPPPMDRAPTLPHAMAVPAIGTDPSIDTGRLPVVVPSEDDAAGPTSVTTPPAVVASRQSASGRTGRSAWLAIAFVLAIAGLVGALLLVGPWADPPPKLRASPIALPPLPSRPPPPAATRSIPLPEPPLAASRATPPVVASEPDGGSTATSPSASAPEPATRPGLRKRSSRRPSKEDLGIFTENE